VIAIAVHCGQWVAGVPVDRGSLWIASKEDIAVIVLLYLLQAVIGIGSLVCLVLVLVKMFQNGQTALGIVCIVLAFCGIGVLIAFVYGWIKSTEWDLKKVMLAWTVCLVLGLIVSFITMGMGMSAAMDQMQQAPDLNIDLGN
jgi:hypothetical protein